MVMAIVNIRFDLVSLVRIIHIGLTRCQVCRYAYALRALEIYVYLIHLLFTFSEDING
mgnify:CR=1 FL=1